MHQHLCNEHGILDRNILARTVTKSFVFLCSAGSAYLAHMPLKPNYPWNVLVFPAASEVGLEIHRALRDCKEVVLHGAVQPGDSIAAFHFKRLHTLPSVYEPDCLPRSAGIDRTTQEVSTPYFRRMMMCCPGSQSAPDSCRLRLLVRRYRPAPPAAPSARHATLYVIPCRFPGYGPRKTTRLFRFS